MCFNMIFASIWPDNVYGWVILIAAIAGLVSTVIALIPTAITCVKVLRKLIKNKNFEAIKNIAVAAIKTAEASQASGADKKAMVIEAVKAGCREAQIDLDESLLDDLSKYIDQMIGYHNDMRQIENNK